jgi:CBS domain containing-hemolysin-like protein
MTILALVVFLTIFISANCSLYEAVLYSTRIGSLEGLTARAGGSWTVRHMLQMKRNISAPIAAILILNTIANTAGATVAGMYAADELGSAAVPLFSAGLTLGILIFSEIVPKTVGAVYWPVVWPLTVVPLLVMRKVLFPLIFVTEGISKLLTRGNQSVDITEEDILGVTRLGARHGEISEWESLMVHNVISLEEKAVREIMTPRTVMFSLDETMPVSEALDAAAEKGFTRIPVYREDHENVTGYVMLHDLASGQAQEHPDRPVGEFAQEIRFVAETANCLTLLATFLRRRLQIAVVADEYGGLSGLVTLEDLVETLLGTEIVDEKDAVVNLRELARRQRQERYNL